MTEKKTVLILAAGKAKRFNGVCKQLLDIKGEAIIERIMRQCYMRKSVPFVVTDNREIAKFVSSSTPVFRPEKRSVTTETFLYTQDLWNERTIILLGDVIYSKKLMDEIFSCTDPIRVYGNTWEVFAVSFHESQHEDVISALERTIPVFPAKVRTFYRVFCGFDPDCDETEGEALEDVVWFWINDWSRDIDTMEEYVNSQRELVNTNQLDDRKWPIK